MWAALAIGAAIVLLARPKGSQTSRSDAGDGAPDTASAAIQVTSGGRTVPLGQYVDGQLVQAMEAHPYGFFFGRGPSPATSWAITAPVAVGPNSQRWKYGKAGEGLKAGDGSPLTGRFRQSLPVDHEPTYAPIYPQQHAQWRAEGRSQGRVADGARPVGFPQAGDAPNVPERRQVSRPGVLARDESGSLVPLVESWHTVNYSGITLRRGDEDRSQRGKVRLFIGATMYTAGYQADDGKWYHLAFGEMRGRLSWLDPGSITAFPRDRERYRAVPATARPWQDRASVFGRWLAGRSYLPNLRNWGGVFRTGWVVPGQDTVSYLARGAGQDRAPATGPTGSGQSMGGAAPLNICFPDKPERWSGRQSMANYGLFFYLDVYTEEWDHPRSGAMFNIHAYNDRTFNYPARHGQIGDGTGTQRYWECEQNFLPYPPTAPVQLSELLKKKYVQVLPVKRK